jgi:glycosyltransferase involved in cell wall biosynthesis
VGRVAFVYDRLYPYTVGGAERYYHALARALGCDQPVTLITRRFWDGPARRMDGEVELVGVTGSGTAGDRPAPYATKIAFAVGLVRHLLLHGGRYRVVHCACFPGLAPIACHIGLLPHRSTLLIIDWHEVLPRATWHRRRGRMGDLGWLVQRLGVRSGRAAVTFSQLHQHRLRHEGRDGKILLLPEFPPELHELPARDGPARERLIVSVGRLVNEKRSDLVPYVVRELRHGEPDWRAVVFGSGPDGERVARAVRDAGVEDAVRLAGFAPWEEVSNAMLRAQALVFPTMREGFGLAVLEAFAHGLPAVLVAEPDNAATELIQPGENGIVCDSADPALMARAVRCLAADPSIHDRTRGSFERLSRRHSLESAVAELRTAHERLLAGDPS